MLPELKSEGFYTMSVEAKYKDYLPIRFDLKVEYALSLDGHQKILDLGTHVFYKSSMQKPSSPFTFKLSNVMDDGVDDDYDNYDLALYDPMR